MPPRLIHAAPTDDQMSRAIKALAAYKDREASIVLGLGRVQQAINDHDAKQAQLAIDALMSSDLSDARKEMTRMAQALDIAIAALTKVHLQDVNDGRVWDAVEEPLRRMAKLVPDAFPILKRDGMASA